MNQIEYVTQAKEALRNLKKRYNKSKSRFAVKSVNVTRQGKFTVVTINDDVIGVTLCGKDDKPNFTTGFNIALNRALRHALKIKAV